MKSALQVTLLLATLGCPALCPARDWTEIRQFGPFACHADFPLREVESVLNGLARLQQDLLDARRELDAQRSQGGAPRRTEHKTRGR